MAIKAYVGRMGSGKTYEVVSVVILQALARGRRVVSNIAGLRYDEFVKLLEAKGISKDNIGELIQIDHAKVIEPNFWRTDKDDEQKTESFLQPGDLLALDEIWRFWEGFNNKAMPERVMNFYRMHRHFTHSETGVACDVVLITQDVMDIARRVRAVIEETYSMTKLTAIGSSKRYRVDVFQGGKVSRKPLKSLQRSYEQKYFPLYNSHSQKKEGDADAKEENIDKRGNILSGALFKIVLPLGVVAFGFSVWFLWGFFHKPIPPKADKLTPLAQINEAPPKPPQPAESPEWRASGYWVDAQGVAYFFLTGEGKTRVIQPPASKLTAMTVELFLPNGEAVTSWTGKAKEGQTLQPGLLK